MRLRFALLRAETQMLGLLFVLGFLQNGFPLALLVISCVYPAVLMIMPPVLGIPLAILSLLCLLSTLLEPLFTLARADAPSGPTRLISDFPALQRLADAICDKLGKPRLSRLVFGLAPGKWDMAQRSVSTSLSNTPQGTLPLPVLSVGVWSVTEIEAYVARAVARRRGPRWLLSRAECAIELLARSYEHDLTTARHGAKVRAYLFPRLQAALARWIWLAEMRADFDAAIVVGPSAVMSCVILDKFVTESTSIFLEKALGPALNGWPGTPLYESFAAFVSTTRPKYEDAMREFIVDEPGAATPVPVARISLLAKLPAGIHKIDHRRATSLIPNLRQLEREVLEYDRPDASLSVKSWNDTPVQPEALLRFLRLQLMKKAAMLRDKTLADIPALLREHKQSEDFKRVLFAVSAFLVVSMINDGWELASTDFRNVPVELHMRGRSVLPFDLIQKLADGAITDENFLRAITPSEPGESY